MKDNFSSNSEGYAKYRPTYPNAFFAYLYALLPIKLNAWDCGTGNGQIAYQLSKVFKHVYGTDISQSQLDNAFKADNINYSVQPAEHTNFADNTFDLVIVAQAIHWFDFNAFYTEVKRVAKPNAKLCVVGYGNIKISKTIDPIIYDFYTNIIGKYWDDERKYIDQNYETIPFPFEEIKTTPFINTKKWELKHLIGYLNTWSSVKHYIDQHKSNPVEVLEIKLKEHWKDNEIKEVTFPILLRIGNIDK
ncbi:class I SAM-dependent methyltransferase [Winogradskyella sp. PC D3.3]